MTVLFFLELRGSSGTASILDTTILETISSSASTLPGLSALYRFTPADGDHDPFLRDENPPGLVLQVRFNDEEQFRLALVSEAMSELLASFSSEKSSGTVPYQEALLLDPYLSCKTESGFADLSYLVNYQRPAEDEAVFLDYYRTHHPPILERFPGIRRLELGLPFDWSPLAGVKHANRMLFCEVSFDDVDALNTALKSRVRAELRRDYDRFPPFSGPVSHFAMHRVQIL